MGDWVPEHKHRLLREYLHASRHAWEKWPNRVFIDPFAGPGRIRVKGEAFTRDGGSMLAWRVLPGASQFTAMLAGDIDAERIEACERRLKAVGAPAKAFVGSATNTIKSMVSSVPQGSLCMAYVDPYSLEMLSFSILQELSKLPNVDLAINFCTMDLQRNVEMEFDPNRARFDGTAPGWRDDPAIRAASKQNQKIAFFRYWCDLVQKLGFAYSKEMPLVPNKQGHPIYRMVFFARHKFPMRIWADVARGPNRSFDF